MKRFATILLLALLFFNWVGYRFFTAYLEDKANANLEAQLDNNNYDESQLLSIKVPVTNLAYYSTSKTFERVDGEIELNGLIYKFVKRRLYRDSLELLCIPNSASMELKSAKDEFFKLVNDLQAGNQTKKSDSHKNFCKVFSTENYTVAPSFALNDLFFSLAKKLNDRSETMSPFYSPTDEQPPDILL